MIKISLSNFQFIKATKVPEKYLASSQGLDTPKIFFGSELQYYKTVKQPINC